LTKTKVFNGPDLLSSRSNDLSNQRHGERFHLGTILQVSGAESVLSYSIEQWRRPNTSLFQHALWSLRCPALDVQLEGGDTLSRLPGNLASPYYKLTFGSEISERIIAFSSETPPLGQ
jgi:hypothetical protein